MSTNILSQQQINEFNNNGVLLIPDFYDTDDINQIQHCIYNIIGLVIDKYKLSITRHKYSADKFDSGYQKLIKINRDYGSEIYDAVKQIPAFIRLVADKRHESLLSQLRNTTLAGIAAGGFGIRIDNPHEDKFRAQWHQEYPAQLRSPDGLVFWSSLINITPELGPVKFCLGSHKLGPVPVYMNNPKNTQNSGAYSLTLKDEQQLIKKFPQIAPLTKPGDLVIIDYMVLHASGVNRGNRSRWSMQMRYFNFNNPAGIEIGWKGSFAAGLDFREIHPELCIDN